MSTITFQHGPVTVTIEGLPETVSDSGVGVALSLFSHPYDDEPAAFAANFAALGGTGLFGDVDPADAFYPHHTTFGEREDGTVTRMDSRLTLHPPLKGAMEAITAALRAEADEAALRR